MCVCVQHNVAFCLLLFASNVSYKLTVKNQICPERLPSYSVCFQLQQLFSVVGIVDI